MNCDLDLRLSQPPALTAGETTHNYFNPQQLTVFYNGRICVCDVTEIQARAVIWQASKLVEQGRYDDRKISTTANAPATSSELPISPASKRNASLSSSASSGLSMKKSLQSFLQKRKHRQLATSPYGNVNR